MSVLLLNPVESELVRVAVTAHRALQAETSRALAESEKVLQGRFGMVYAIYGITPPAEPVQVREGPEGRVELVLPEPAEPVDESKLEAL
jgi:hypothetical protein